MKNNQDQLITTPVYIDNRNSDTFTSTPSVAAFITENNKEFEGLAIEWMKKLEKKGS